MLFVQLHASTSTSTACLNFPTWVSCFWNTVRRFVCLLTYHHMPPRKSRAKPKDVSRLSPIDADSLEVPAPKRKRAPDIQWARNPDWTHTLIEYFTNHVEFRIKLFSDSTADATREGRSKHTAKDSKAQQYAMLAKAIFANEPGQSALYLQNPGRYATAVETRLRR